MPTPRSLPLSPRLLPWLLALAIAACGGGPDEALATARLRIQRGELELATAALTGTSGPRADALRAEIDAGLRHRAEVETALREIAETAPDQDAQWSILRINALLASESDPLVRERITQVQSDVATHAAGERRSRARATDQDALETAPAPAVSARSVPETDGSRLARAAIDEARGAQSRRQWRSALALALGAAQDSSVAADARQVQQSILSAARVEAEAVITKARNLEREGKLAEAARFFRAELERFPASDEFASLRFESELTSERAAGAAPAAALPRKAPAEAHALPERVLDAELARAASPDECEALALWRTTAGDLAGARAAWLESARRKSDPAWREESERKARELELRIALREELADYARVDEETARVLGLENHADDSGARKLELVPLAEIARLVERDQLSSKARLGWLVETIVRGDERERENALQGLGAALARREIDPLHASSLVARAKGAIGDGGWVYRGGKWLEGSVARAAAAQDEKSAQGTQSAQLIGEFRRSTAFERDAALAAIVAQGDPDLLGLALAKRWEDDWERLEKNPNLRQLAALAEERRALDAARKNALDLIFDEERYFYPYNPPECPPQKAAKYAAVQREVDELVRAVRLVWESAKRVKIGDALRGELAEAAWTAERAKESGLEVCKVEEGWRFALALPAGSDVGLADFAWDARERAALEESDRVEARNERLWTALEKAKPADSVPSSDEERQVRITNAYRRMLGRRALAWNPKIQAAAQGHSDHMANTGDFSHFEQGDPARRTPFDRLRLAGYPLGVSENISMGHGDPQSTHEGWTHSSGHHRNLLAQSHREMASAIASSYWTQNFGVDSSFTTDL